MDMIYHDGDVEKCRRDAIYNRVPFLEMKVSKGLSGELPQPSCLAWVEREQSQGRGESAGAHTSKSPVPQALSSWRIPHPRG